MKEVLFATENPSKIKRFSRGLYNKGIKVIALKDINTKIDIEENGQNAIENAQIKARAYAKEVNIPVFAMDDTLYLENVPAEKQPGMYVRRVNGKRLSDEEMIKYYIDLVKKYGKDGKLNCKWIYGIAVISNGKESTYSWNRDNFYMVDKPSNIINPGYPLNSISVDKKLNKYYTDMTEEDKVLTQETEDDVIEFISNCINNK